jgi:hypothetical protein
MMNRIKEITRSSGAGLIIQNEAHDIGLLRALPEAMR